MASDCSISARSRGHSDMLKKMEPIINEAQVEGSSIQEAIQQINEVYHQSNSKVFADVLWRIMVIPFVENKNANMDRIRALYFELLSTIGTRVCNVDGSTYQMDVTFVRRILSLCTKYHADYRSNVRYYICETMAIILQIGDVSIIDVQTMEKLSCVMLQRMQDKSSNVRTQAVKVLAISCLVVRGEVLAKIKNVLFYHLKWDPHAEVRHQILEKLSFPMENHVELVEKVNDISEEVRQMALTKLRGIRFNELTSEHRDRVLHSALSDGSVPVKKAGKLLLHEWMEEFSNDVVKFIEHLGVGHNRPTAELLLRSLYSNTELFDTVNQSLFKEKVIPVSEITPESAFYWRFIVETFSMPCIMDKVLPPLPFMCSYLKAFMREFGKASCGGRAQNILLQLLKIAGRIPVEEGGRKEFLSTLIEIFGFEHVTEIAVKHVVLLMHEFISDDSDFDSILVETLERKLECSSITDFQHPPSEEEIKALKLEVGALIHQRHKREREKDAAVRKSDYAMAQQIQDEINQILERIETLRREMERRIEESNEMTNSNVRDKRYSTSAISVVFTALIVHIRLTKNISSQVRAFFETYVAKSIFSQEACTRKQVLTIMTLMGLVSRSDAHDALIICGQALIFDEVDVQMRALQCLVDLVQHYGFDEFKDNSALQEVLEKHKSESVDDEVVCPLRCFLMSFLLSEQTDIVGIAVTGIIKLLLSGRINSSRLVATMLILWSNMTNGSSTVCRDISRWLPLFVRMGLHQSLLVGDALVPCVQRIQTTTEGVDYQESVKKLATFVIKYTDESYLVDYVATPYVVHERIASNILREMKNLGSNVLSACYAKNLRTLNLSSCKDESIQTLKRKTSYLLRMSGKKNSPSLRGFLKYLNNISQMVTEGRAKNDHHENQSPNFESDMDSEDNSDVFELR